MKRTLLALLLAAPMAAQAATATLKWTPPANKSGIDGYQVRYGTAAGARTSTVDVSGANTATATVPDLSNGTVYYFAVRSRNAAGTVFSVDSNEVSAAAALAAPGSVTITITITAE